MSDDRKPLWPWIAAVLIGLPVLYVLAAPMFSYVAFEFPHPYSLWANEAIGVVYRPLFWLMDRCPAFSHVWYLYMDHWP
jgi:hypothetical protein